MAVRALRLARSSAVKARPRPLTDLREKLRHLTTGSLIDTCVRLRLSGPPQVIKAALRRLGRRHQHLTQEILAAAPAGAPGQTGRSGAVGFGDVCRGGRESLPPTNIRTARRP